MKKVFTLIFSLGLLTAAFAQDGRHNRDDSRSSGFGNQSYGYQDHHNGSDQGYKTSPYSNSDTWNYQSNDRRDQGHYGNEQNRNGYGDKNDMRGWSGENRFDRGKHKPHFQKRQQGLQLSFRFGRNF